jgi:ABC-type Fe3+-hydroxamate transport system substrate-binding protein
LRRTVAIALLLLTALSLGACGREAPADRGSRGDRASPGGQAPNGLADTAAVGPGAAPADAPLTVVDDAGRRVTLAAPARRVISLIPSVNELVVAMGAADRLVARTDYDKDPRLAGLPSVGGGLTPSLEWIAQRRPDLVIGWPDTRSRSLVERLGRLGIPVYTASSQTIEDAFSVAENLGVLLGRRAAADSLVRAIRTGLDSVRASVSGEAKPDVLYLIGLDPPMGAGPGTFVDELLDVAGGRNVLQDTGVLWPQLSLEDIVRRDPDIVIVAQAPQQPGLLRHLRSAAGWSSLRAVRDGRVYQVDAYRYNRPGPHMVEIARDLAGLLHGARP